MKKVISRVCPAYLEGFSFPYNSEWEGGREEGTSVRGRGCSFALNYTGIPSPDKGIAIPLAKKCLEADCRKRRK